jgi:hypothetical protein
MDSQIADFIALTGSSPEEAMQYLEMANFDADLAINLFMDMGSSNRPKDTATSNRADPIDLDSDTEGIRRPIAARLDRLIEHPSHMSFTHHDAEDAPSDSEYMFAPPLLTNTSASPFQLILARAKAANKYVLVAIQDPEIFASHVLNRDVWADEVVRDVVTQNFEFFLRDRNSPDGTAFVALYRLEKFPVIGIVDGRTGRMVKKWEKCGDAMWLVEELTVWLDKIPSNPVGGTAAPSSIADSPSAVTRATAVDTTATTEAPAPVATLPELPALGTAGTLRLAIRLSSGTREQIAVYPSTAVAVLLQWAAAREGLASVDLKTAPPNLKSVRMDVGETATVADAGLEGALLTVVKGF